MQGDAVVEVVDVPGRTMDYRVLHKLCAIQTGSIGVVATKNNLSSKPISSCEVCWCVVHEKQRTQNERRLGRRRGGVEHGGIRQECGLDGAHGTVGGAMHREKTRGQLAEAGLAKVYTFGFPVAAPSLPALLEQCSTALELATATFRRRICGEGDSLVETVGCSAVSVSPRGHCSLRRRDTAFDAAKPCHGCRLPDSLPSSGREEA